MNLARRLSDHIDEGSCPAEDQWNSRDLDCGACLLLNQIESDRRMLAWLTLQEAVEA